MSFPKQELDAAIQAQDSLKLSQIVQAVLNNPKRSYESAIAAFNYVECNYPSAISEFKEGISPIILEQSNWSEDYYYDHKVELSYNFCRERFEHVLTVAQYLESKGYSDFQKVVEMERAPDIGQVPFNDTATKLEKNQSAFPLKPALIAGGALALLGLIMLLTR